MLSFGDGNQRTQRRKIENGNPDGSIQRSEFDSEILRDAMSSRSGGPTLQLRVGRIAAPFALRSEIQLHLCPGEETRHLPTLAFRLHPNQEWLLLSDSDRPASILFQAEPMTAASPPFYLEVRLQRWIRFSSLKHSFVHIFFSFFPAVPSYPFLCDVIPRRRFIVFNASVYGGRSFIYGNTRLFVCYCYRQVKIKFVRANFFSFFSPYTFGSFHFYVTKDNNPD